MDLMGMMGKLKETQQKIEDTKKRLDTVLIDEQSSDGLLKITVTANTAIKSITIADALLKDKEQLEDYLILVLNKAIARANQVNQTELDAVAKMDHNYQKIIHLRFFEEKSIKEIAEELNLSVANTKVRIMRAKKVLAELLNENE